MANFFVGQRIKKVRGGGAIGANVGMEATVAALSVPSQPGKIEVIFDGVWLNANGEWMPSSESAYAVPSNFEPIKPLPTAHELMTREGAPDWSVPRVGIAA